MGNNENTELVPDMSELKREMEEISEAIVVIVSGFLGAIRLFMLVGGLGQFVAPLPSLLSELH